MSASFLSQAENDKARPRIETLHRIAAALGTTAQALLADAASGDGAQAGNGEVRVTRAADDGVVQQGVDPADGVVRSLVTGSVGLHAMEIRGAPASFGAHYDRGGTEMLYVVSGNVEVEVGGESHRLGPGDAEIRCIPTCTSPDDPPRHPPVTSGQWVLDKLSKSVY